MQGKQRNSSVTPNAFAWRETPLTVDLRKLDIDYRRQQGNAMAAWRTGSRGVIPIRPIDQPRHGGAYLKAKA